jgi:hypothetical protein
VDEKTMLLGFQEVVTGSAPPLDWPDDHGARPAGHRDVVRELLDGATGLAPR